MGRSPCCAKEGLNKGAWTAMEDKILTDYIKLHGEGRWRGLPKRAGLKRCGKSCRLRWLNYLRPDIKRGNITGDEEELIIRLHKLLGNRWSLIAGRLPGRTDNEIKNYWNTNLSKRLQDLHHRSNVKQPENAKATKSSIVAQTIQAQNTVQSKVIRTKAVKCTKVFISPLPPPTSPSSNPQMKEALTNILVDTNMNNSVSSEGLMENPLIDLAADFDMMGELNFSEFMNSQHMLDICCEFSHGRSDEGDQFSPSPSLEEPIVFPEEMMEDWRKSGCGLDTSTFEFWLGD